MLTVDNDGSGSHAPQERPAGNLFDDPYAPAIGKGEPLTRPPLRSDLKATIEVSAPKNAKGQFVDPKTGKVIVDRDYGHIYGRENRRIIAAGKELGLTQAQLNDYVNARPEFFKIEEHLPNIGHGGEMKGLHPYDHIIVDMENFFGL